MGRLEVSKLSKRYSVRKLNLEDVEMLYTFCKCNVQYYEYCGKDISPELIEDDLIVLPPGIPMEQKYYIGFFDKNVLVAVMDLIIGYPNSNSVYIGFFMMDRELQGIGIGSLIIFEVLHYLKKRGFEMCRLGIDKANPQSNYFWRKNGFEVIREVAQKGEVILVAEKQL